MKRAACQPVYIKIRLKAIYFIVVSEKTFTIVHVYKFKRFDIKFHPAHVFLL